MSFLNTTFIDMTCSSSWSSLSKIFSEQILTLLFVHHFRSVKYLGETICFWLLTMIIIELCTYLFKHVIKNIADIKNLLGETNNLWEGLLLLLWNEEWKRKWIDNLFTPETSVIFSPCLISIRRSDRYHMNELVKIEEKKKEKEETDRLIGHDYNDQ